METIIDLGTPPATTTRDEVRTGASSPGIGQDGSRVWPVPWTRRGRRPRGDGGAAAAAGRRERAAGGRGSSRVSYELA